MKKNLILTAFLGLNLLGVFSCATSNLDSRSYGYLRTTVSFPDKKFSLKVIPDTTKVISVRVTGAGLTNPIRFNLTKENPSNLLLEVPEGPKTIDATAMNAEGKTVAKGQGTKVVIARTFNTVTVNLTEVAVIDETPEFSPTPTPTPTPSPSGSSGSEVLEPGSTGPSGNPSIEPSVQPSAIPSSNKCVVIIKPTDYPLTQTLESSIREAGCDIALPSPTPTATVPPSSGSGGSRSSGGNTSPALPVTVNVGDGTDVPAGIGLE